MKPSFRLVSLLAASTVVGSFASSAAAVPGPPPTQMIVNGDFAGGLASWTRPGDDGESCGTNFHVNDTGETNCNAIEGNATMAAYNSFDGAGPVTWELSQSFTAPLGVTSAALSFRDAYVVSMMGGMFLGMGGEELPRTFKVVLSAGESSIEAYSVSASGSASQAWTDHDADVTAFLQAHGGETVTIHFRNFIPENYTGPGGFGLDDVSLLVHAALPVAIAPANPPTHPKGSIAFGASGGSNSFTWSISENLSGCTLDSSTGLYTAGPGSGVDVIVATDSNGASSSTSIEVGPGISTSPLSPKVRANGALELGAAGGSGSGFAWALVENHSGGSVDASGGHYLAGPTPNVTDVLMVTDSAGNQATVDIQVGYAFEFEGRREETSPAPASPTTPKAGYAIVDVDGELDRQDEQRILSLGGGCALSTSTSSGASTASGLVAMGLALLALRRKQKAT